MKILICIGFFFIAASCCSFRKQNNGNRSNSSSQTRYLVKRTDQLNDSIFILYATKNDALYKIVSFRYAKSKCDEIKVGEYYLFNLKSLIRPPGSESTIDSLGLAVMAQNVDAIMYHDNFIFLEKDLNIIDVYEATNLDGLKLIDCKN
jgi:hypothetical protein